jgi:hypothetical protein
MLEAGTHPLPFGPEPDAPDALPSRSQHLGALLATGRSIPLPVSGGAPDGPYEPTESDWASYCAWSRELDASDDFPKLKDLEDRRRDRADVRDWYRDHREGV